MGKVLAVCVQKGGAGKTTTSCNLAEALAKAGQKVLGVDMDAQAHLTRALGVAKGQGRTVNDLLFEEAKPEEAIIGTSYDVDLVPATIDLAAVEKRLLADPIDPNSRLREALDPVRDRYDFIIIDCPPELGALTLNALVAADQVLIPFEANGLGTDGVAETLNTINRVKKRLNPSLQIAGILANRFDPRTVLARAVLDQTREYFRGKVRVFNAVIRETSSLQDAITSGMPAGAFKSKNRSHKRAVQSYADLAQELMEVAQ